MTITQFIEKAIEGGWTKVKSPFVVEGHYHDWIAYHDGSLLKKNKVYEYFLDPEAWKAVGRIEGWILEDGTDVAKYYMNNPKRTAYPMWLFEMHRMIDALAEGRSIEQYLETL